MVEAAQKEKYGEMAKRTRTIASRTNLGRRMRLARAVGGKPVMPRPKAEVEVVSETRPLGEQAQDAIHKARRKEAREREARERRLAERGGKLF